MWGGEHQARTPIDSSLHVSRIEGEERCELVWEVLVCSEDSLPPPSPRIAHSQTVIGSKLYIFGGRAGITMNEQPFNDLHCFDTISGCWSGPLQTTGSVPSVRSFHKVASTASTLYVFGGCGEQGRLADLFALDMDTLSWTELPSCEHIHGRGGSSFATLHNNEYLVVTTGYSGQENNDIYLFHIESKVWTVVAHTQQEADVSSGGSSHYFRPRSVCPFFTSQDGEFMFLFGGEVSTSDRGHEGAGDFASDLVALQFKASSGEGGNCGELCLVSTVNVNEGVAPPARGWTSMTSIAPATSSNSLLQREELRRTPCLGGALLFGGLTGDDVSPTRLDDTWLLLVHLVE